MSFRGVLCVLLLASVGPSWEGIVVEVPGNDLDSRICPHEAIPGTQFTLPFILLNTQHECCKPTHGIRNQLNFAADTAAFQRIFQKACVQTPEVKSCIEGVASDADVCLSSDERKMFKTVRDFAERSIDMVCADDSETVAKIFANELKALDFFGQVRVLSCLSAMALKTKYENETDIPAFTMRRYLAMQQGKQCIVNVAKAKRKSAAEFLRFADSLLEGMECISPTGEIVICNSITDSNSSES